MDLKNWLKKNKGQISIYAIIMLVVALIVLSAMFPLIKDVTASAKSNATTTTESLLLDLIPVCFILGFIATIFIYVSVQRPYQPQ